MSSSNLIFILSTICGTRAVEAISCVQKSKKTFQDLIKTDSQECVTIICLYTHSNQPRASQICIGVIIVLSIKTQSLCDVLICRELNEITPTATDDWTFYDKPWGIGLAAIF